jgi:hypothetical protein
MIFEAGERSEIVEGPGTALRSMGQIGHSDEIVENRTAFPSMGQCQFGARFFDPAPNEIGQGSICPVERRSPELLRGFPFWEYSTWVFPSKTLGSHMNTYNFYRRIFCPAVEKAKLEGVTWHTLRHTFASRLAMNIQNDSTIAALLRHRGTSLIQRHAHLSPIHLSDTVERVSGFGKTTRKEEQPTKKNQGIQVGTGTGTGKGEINKEKEVA